MRHLPTSASSVTDSCHSTFTLWVHRPRLCSPFPPAFHHHRFLTSLLSLVSSTTSAFIFAPPHLRSRISVVTSTSTWVGYRLPRQLLPLVHASTAINPEKEIIGCTIRIHHFHHRHSPGKLYYPYFNKPLLFLRKHQVGK